MPARGVAVELGVRRGRRGMGRVGGARTAALAISFPISSRCTSPVGDFGMSRWQPDGDMGVETRVIGTFGYLAPEYAQSGQITEKADVYSFGVVLVELVTGRKAVDINRPKGQQLLTEWPLLEEHAIDDLIDPRLEDRFCENEVYCMLHASNLCIRRDPHSSPRMSHVLRILEGDMVVESGACISALSSDAGSMSRRMLSDRLHYQEQGSPVQPDPQPRRVGEVNRSPRPSCLSIQAMV